MTRATYDINRLADDMAAKGWLAADLARKAGVSKMTVSRVLNSDSQSARTMAKLAEALGYTVRRYLRRVA